ERWPDRVVDVVARDDDRGLLLLADAGTPLNELGNPPETWLEVLPSYAELQRGETTHVTDHLEHGVPDARVATLPAAFEHTLAGELPVDGHDAMRLRALAPNVLQLSDELASGGISESVQHDDLHHRNVFRRGAGLRIVD